MNIPLNNSSNGFPNFRNKILKIPIPQVCLESLSALVMPYNIKVNLKSPFYSDEFTLYIAKEPTHTFDKDLSVGLLSNI